MLLGQQKQQVGSLSWQATYGLAGPANASSDRWCAWHYFFAFAFNVG